MGGAFISGIGDFVTLFDIDVLKRKIFAQKKKLLLHNYVLFL